MENPRFEVEEATINQIQQAFKENLLTSVELVEFYLDQIEQFDKNGPKINSVLSLNEDALKIAAELDDMRGQQGQGPLYGIPVLLKDNINTTDPMPTTAGAIALRENFARKDAFVAAKLRSAGAIILGKANLSEWANFMSDNAPSGYSGLGGQVLNPYGAGTFEAGSVGGSSSGTGAAIASNFAVVGIGTETSGSILSPASVNSLVGIKPTVGLISRHGIIPIAHSQDTPGPMARTVEDAAITLGVLTGEDESDPVTHQSVGNGLTDYTAHLITDGLKGARLGVDRSYLSEMGKDERAVMERAIEKLSSLGAIVEEVALPKSGFESEVLWYEFNQGVNDYLRNVSEAVPIKSLADVIEFNKENPELRMKFGQAHLEKALALGSDAQDPRYLEHRDMDINLSAVQGIDAVMAKHRLDALIFENNHGAQLPAKAGYPSITVPAGYTNTGMPVGITFSAQAYSEPRLIELAYSYEQATQKRKTPHFA